MAAPIIQKVRDIGSSLLAAKAQGHTVCQTVASGLSGAGVLSIFVDDRDDANQDTSLVRLDAVVEAAKIDASYGWLLMAFGLAIFNCSKYLSANARNRVFGGGVPIIAGQYQPRGRAHRTEDGYVLSGDWMFGSGIEHAQWLVAGFLIIEDGRVELDDNCKPRILIGVMPNKDFTVNHGSWNVMGLEETRSFDFSCREVFVPQENCFDFNSACATKPGCQQWSLLDSAYAAHGAWAVGAGLGILSAFRESAKHIVRANESSPLVAHAGIVESYGRTLAGLLSARALIGELLASGPSDPCHEYILNTSNSFQMAGTFATDQAVGAVDFVMRYVGTSGIRAGSPIQRFFRDIQTGRQHMMVSQKNYEIVGESLLRGD